MAFTFLNTMKRVSKFVDEFMETDFDNMLIRDELVLCNPLNFRTFVNHSIRAYDIKGVKAVVRKGHVYLVRDKNTA